MRQDKHFVAFVLVNVVYDRFFSGLCQVVFYTRATGMRSLMTACVAIVILALQTVYHSAALPQSPGGARPRHEISMPEGVLNALRARGVPEGQLEPHKRNRAPVAPKIPLVRPLVVRSRRSEPHRPLFVPHLVPRSAPHATMPS